MKTLHYIALTITLLTNFYVYGNNNCNCKPDSLRRILNKTTSIEEKVTLSLQLSNYYLDVNIDSTNYFDSLALNISINGDYLEGEVKSLAVKSKNKQLQGNFDAAIESIELAKEKSKNINDKTYLGRTHLLAGILYEQLVIYNIAFENYIQALHFFEKVQDTSKIINALNYIGGIYKIMNDNNNALKYYSKALGYAEKSSDKFHIIMITNNLAIIYSRKRQSEKAMKMYKKALSMNLRNKNYNWAAINNLNISLEFIDIEKYDSAEQYLLNALNLGKLYNDVYTDASVISQLGNFYLTKENLNKTAYYLNQADSIASFYLMFDILADVKGGLAEMYAQIGDYKNEAKYLREYKMYSDSLLSDKNTNELIGIKFKYIYENKSKEQELKNQKAKYITIITISFSILVIVIFILLYLQQKTKVYKERIEKERTSLQNKNLQQNLELKNKEITSNTLIQLQRNELLISIIEKLQDVKSEFAEKNHKIIDKTIDELKRSMNENTWESFLIYFENVHESFFSNLNTKSENLTRNDKRLCAFLKLKMSTKEIANITNTNIRSIEMARHRLRKKLNIGKPNISLDSFFEDV